MNTIYLYQRDVDFKLNTHHITEEWTLYEGTHYVIFFILVFTTVLDIIHRPVLYLRHDVCAHLSSSHLKTETESSLENVLFYIKDRTMDNV
jgi:hypothetical protein